MNILNNKNKINLEYSLVSLEAVHTHTHTHTHTYILDKIKKIEYFFCKNRTQSLRSVFVVVI